MARAKLHPVKYQELDRLEVEVILYMSDRQLHAQDVDNLTKHVFDALQGKLGGKGKTKQSHAKLIETDARIHRLTIEKRKPNSTKLKSRLIVRGYRVPR